MDVAKKQARLGALPTLDVKILEAKNLYQLVANATGPMIQLAGICRNFVRESNRINSSYLLSKKIQYYPTFKSDLKIANEAINRLAFDISMDEHISQLVLKAGKMSYVDGNHDAWMLAEIVIKADEENRVFTQDEIVLSASYAERSGALFESRLKELQGILRHLEGFATQIRQERMEIIRDANS